MGTVLRYTQRQVNERQWQEIWMHCIADTVSDTSWNMNSFDPFYALSGSVRTLLEKHRLDKKNKSSAGYKASSERTVPKHQRIIILEIFLATRQKGYRN